jgi:hypothetical protein
LRPSEQSAIPTTRPSAGTTSRPPDMSQVKGRMLYDHVRFGQQRPCWRLGEPEFRQKAGAADLARRHLTTYATKRGLRQRSQSGGTSRGPCKRHQRHSCTILAGVGRPRRWYTRLPPLFPCHRCQSRRMRSLTETATGFVWILSICIVSDQGP